MNSTPAVVDLSHVIREGCAHPPTQPGPELAVLRWAGKDGAAATLSQMKITTHTGTHIDSPAHILPDGATMDAYPIEFFSGHAVCAWVDAEPRQPIEAEQLASATGGLLEPGDMLFVGTGWSEHFYDDHYYQHPYLSEAAARWIVDAGVRIFGSDTLTPDEPSVSRAHDFHHPVHRILLGAGIPIIENAARLDQVAGRRFEVLVAPLKVDAPDGAPCRIVGWTG